MSNPSNFTVRIEGQRDGRPLQPDTVDAGQLAELLLATRTLVAGEKNRDAIIPISIEKGSVLLTYKEDSQRIARVHRQLSSYWNDKQPEALTSVQRKAMTALKQIVDRVAGRLTLSIGKGLDVTITPRTELPTSEATYVEAELHLSGTITSLGGKTNPNVHLVANDDRFGTLIIDVPRQLLLEDERNRLYKPQKVRLSIRQNLHTGEYDTKSAKLIRFEDASTEAHEDPTRYLDRLIGKATESWRAIGNGETWLKEIRGYNA